MARKRPQALGPGAPARLGISHKHACGICIASQPRRTPQGALVMDLMAVVHMFGTRLPCAAPALQAPALSHSSKVQTQ